LCCACCDVCQAAPHPVPRPAPIISSTNENPTFHFSHIHGETGPCCQKGLTWRRTGSAVWYSRVGAGARFKVHVRCEGAATVCNCQEAGALDWTRLDWIAFEWIGHGHLHAGHAQRAPRVAWFWIGVRAEARSAGHHAERAPRQGSCRGQSCPHQCTVG
jgi:hypothetical protein